MEPDLSFVLRQNSLNTPFSNHLTSLLHLRLGMVFHTGFFNKCFATSKSVLSALRQHIPGINRIFLPSRISVLFPARRARHNGPGRLVRNTLCLALLSAICLACISCTNGVLFRTGRPAEKYIVAVDSGHGGSDVGAIGLVEETAITQTTAAYLIALLKADPLYTPVQVHPDDKAFSPWQRVQAAEAAGAELFLSIHANKDTAAASHGFECFAIPPALPWHSESLAFANALCREIAATDITVRGETGVRYAYYRNGAKLMKEASDNSTYDLPTFGILQRAICPAVLAEQCFVSNEQDIALLGTDEGCRLAAACYYRAICAYFGTTPCNSDSAA